MAEEVIISISLEKGDNERQVDALTKKITDLTNANKNLHKANLEMIKTGQQNSKEYLENSRQIEINKQKITEATASRKGLIQTILAEDDSIKGLRARNAELIRQRDTLSTSTAEGKAKIAEINEELDKNNEIIKENVSQLEQQKINIGNYASALDGVLPGIQGFVSGIQNAVTAAKTFIATPLGLAIAAIALALSPLISFLKNTGDGMDFVEEKTTGLKQGLSILQDGFNDLGRQMLEGDTTFVKLVQAFVKANPIVVAFNASVSALRFLLPGLAKDFDEATKAGEAYARAMDEITTESQFFESAAEAEENAIKRLILQSKNRTATEEERIALIDEALDKEQRLAQRRVGFATSEAAQLVAAANQRAKLVRSDSETLQDFATRLARHFDATDNDLRDKLLASLKKIEDARESSISVEEKLQNQRDALADKADERDEKREQDRLARAQRVSDAIFAIEEIRLQRQINGAGSIQERVNKEIELEDLRRNHLLANDKLLAQERTVIEEQYQSAIFAIKQKGVIDEQELQQRKADALNAIDQLRTQQQILNATSIQSRVDKEIELETAKTLLLLENTKLTEEEKQLILEQSQARINAIIAKGQKDQITADKKLAEEKKKIRADEQRGLQASIDAGINLIKSAFGQNKAVAIAETIVNTIRAVSRALADFPFPFSLVVGSLVGAAGAVQTAKLAGVKFAKGGITTMRKLALMAAGGVAHTGGVLAGPLHRHGGIPFTVGGRPGFEAEGGEAIINRKSTSMFRKELSEINQAGGGVAFSRGGVARYQTGSVIAASQTRQASQVAESRTAIRDVMETVMRSFPPIQVSVEDINERSLEVSQQTQKAYVTQ